MQIRRGREADTERLVALAGQIFETEQEIPRALTSLPPENRPQWWCVEEDGGLLGGVALYWEDDAWHMGRFVISPELPGPLPGLLGRPPKTQTSAAGQCAGRRSG